MDLLDFGGKAAQEVYEYGFGYGFQAVKVPNFGGFPVENPTKKATASKLF